MRIALRREELTFAEALGGDNVLRGRIEGVGVTPDVEIEGDALEVALALAEGLAPVG